MLQPGAGDLSAADTQRTKLAQTGQLGESVVRYFEAVDVEAAGITYTVNYRVP